jgi:hypothetical protein
MADRKSKKDNIEHAKKLLRNILPAAVELRDEVFCQIIKQTTNNPSAESTLKGWQLMVLCLGAFPPSPTFAPYLKMYCNTSKEEGEGEMADFAGYALQHIDKIHTIGPRHEVPTGAELEVAQHMQKLEHKIYFLDGTFKEVSIDPWDTSTVRYGTRYGMVRYGTVLRYGTVRYGTVRYGTVSSMVRYGTVLCSSWLNMNTNEYEY